jgi:hypothetical protein
MGPDRAIEIKRPVIEHMKGFLMKHYFQEIFSKLEKLRVA